MSAKCDARLRQAEQRILQYKAVVDYLATKTDPATIPDSNKICISNVLVDNGWLFDGSQWKKGEFTGNLIQAGIKEFGEQYDRLRKAHLRTTVGTFKEG